MDATTKHILKRIQTSESAADSTMMFNWIDSKLEKGEITEEEHEILIDIADWYNYGKHVYNMSAYASGSEEEENR